MWIDKMQGMTCNKDQNGPIFKTMTASGRVYVSHVHSPRTSPASANELAQRQKFTAAVAATQAVMADPVQIATYVAAFKNQHKYFTLRGFVFAQEMAKL